MTGRTEAAAPGEAEPKKPPRPLRWSSGAAQRILLRWHGQVTGEGNGGARSALRRVGPAEDACLVPEYGWLVVRLGRAGFDVPPPRAMRLAAEAVAVAEIDRDAGLARRGDGEAVEAEPDLTAEADVDGDEAEESEEGRDEGADQGREGAPKGETATRGGGGFEERVALSFALALRGPDRSRPLVSPARARLLLQTDEFDPFMRLLRGTLAMLRARNQAVSAVAVAEIVRAWRDPDHRARMRRRIALALADDLGGED